MTVRTLTRATHLVGVVGQVRDGGAQAALRGQQPGVLAHLLGQQDADGGGTGALGLLHRTTQHHHLLHQVLRDGHTDHMSTDRRSTLQLQTFFFGSLGSNRKLKG